VRTYISDLKEHIGKEVTLKGWVYNYRASSKKIKFLILRDGTGLCQCVYFNGECDDSAIELFSEITQESSVVVTGVPRLEERNLSRWTTQSHPKNTALIF